MFYGLTHSILIIDDDLGDSYLLQKALRKLGAVNVDSVSNAEDAAKYLVGLAPFLHRHQPEAIFLDLSLPGMGGFEFAEWLSKNPKYNGIPLVVYSGSSNPADRERAMELGARAYFQKTGETAKLLNVLENILKNLPEHSQNPSRKDSESSGGCYSNTFAQG